MKQKTLLILAAAAAVGYYLYKKSQAAALVQNASANVVVPDIVSGWILQLAPTGQQRFAAQLAQMTQAELNDLANNIAILNNGVPLNSVQQYAWDSWTKKYHIQDGSY